MTGTFGKTLWDHAGLLVADLLPRHPRQLSLGSARNPFKTVYTVFAPQASVVGGLVATGSTIADALLLTSQDNVLGTVAADTGVQLSDKVAVGGYQTVENGGANALDVYPHDSTGAINDLSAGAPFILAAGGKLTAKRVSDANWLVIVEVATALTAAGSVIGDALLLTARYNRVDTVAADTGVQLLADIPIGESQTVKNLGANALDVYPHSASGVLDAESAGDPVVIAVGEEAKFTRLTSTDWGVGVAVAA